MIQNVVEKALTAELPESLNKRLTWLAEDDVTVANAILAESQARETQNSLMLLEKEFSNIEKVLDNVPGTRKVTHALKLPLGKITLDVKRRRGNE